MPLRQMPDDRAAEPLARVRMVADDLTGACDAAVAFAGRGTAVRVRLGPQALMDQGLIAMSTGTRDVPQAQAEAIVTAALRGLPAEAAVFKKVDSVFRGSSAAEIVATLRCFPEALAIIAPAFPEHGRTMRDGVLQYETFDGVMRIDLREALAVHGASLLQLRADTDVATLRAGLHAALQAGSRAVLCDATHAGHLLALCRAARLLAERVVWVGSGGLAQALAADVPRVAAVHEEVDERHGAVLFFVGSEHAATRNQVLHVADAAGLHVRACGPYGRDSGGEDRLFTVRCGVTTEEDIQSSLRGVDPSAVGCLFLTGGDTALLVCRALDIAALRLLREFAPGVPLAVAEGGPFDGVPVLLKSGGFGQRDLLEQVCRVFHADAPAVPHEEKEEWFA